MQKNEGGLNITDLKNRSQSHRPYIHRDFIYHKDTFQMFRKDKRWKKGTGQVKVTFLEKIKLYYSIT